LAAQIRESAIQVADTAQLEVKLRFFSLSLGPLSHVRAELVSQLLPESGQKVGLSIVVLSEEGIGRHSGPKEDR
jgi:hypothetical protein